MSEAILPYFVPADKAVSFDILKDLFAGHALLLPTVSHASVPQLAVDLLLQPQPHLLQQPGYPLQNLKHVGRLDVAGDVFPFVGTSEEGGMVTSVEVYSDASSKVTLLQQRSPVLKARKASFVNRLVEWIRSANFSQVLILSSIDAAFQTDAGLNQQAEIAEEYNRQKTPFLDFVPCVDRLVKDANGRKVLTRSRLFGDINHSFGSILHAGLSTNKFPDDENNPSCPDLAPNVSIIPPSTGLTKRIICALSQRRNPQPGDPLPLTVNFKSSYNPAHLTLSDRDLSRLSSLPRPSTRPQAPKVQKVDISKISTSTDFPLEKDPTVAALFLVVAEGDNRADAHLMANTVLDLLQKQYEAKQGLEDPYHRSKEVRRQYDRFFGPANMGGEESDDEEPAKEESKNVLEEPAAWKALFGNPYDQALYG